MFCFPFLESFLSVLNHHIQRSSELIGRFFGVATAPMHLSLPLIRCTFHHLRQDRMASWWNGRESGHQPTDPCSMALRGGQGRGAGWLFFPPLMLQLHDFPTKINNVFFHSLAIAWWNGGFLKSPPPLAGDESHITSKERARDFHKIFLAQQEAQWDIQRNQKHNVFCNEGPSHKQTAICMTTFFTPLPDLLP